MIDFKFQLMLLHVITCYIYRSKYLNLHLHLGSNSKFNSKQIINIINTVVCSGKMPCEMCAITSMCRRRKYEYVSKEVITSFMRHKSLCFIIIAQNGSLPGYLQQIKTTKILQRLSTHVKQIIKQL